jgi:hypothetical protein
MSKQLTLKHIDDAPVAQLDRASGYEPSRRKLISAAFGVACTKAHRVSAPQVGPKLECAGINRREVANERVVQVRRSEPTWPRVMRG